MPRARRQRRYCQICSKHDSEVGKISARGKCQECGERRLLEHNRQIAACSGPWFDYNRRKSLAALGVVLLDEPPHEV